MLLRLIRFNVSKFEELLNSENAEKKEISQQIFTGEKAMQGLNRAIDSLQNAANWGTFYLFAAA